MAYINDRHTQIGAGIETFDSFDPLLVNLHDSVREYKLNFEKTNDYNGMSQAVIDILDANLSQSEKTLAADILIELIKQAETDIRQNLSERLAPRDDLHPTLLHYMAYDKIDVAEAVLLESPLLSDSDLLYIIQSTTPDHWNAISKRPNISANVIDSLIVRKNDSTTINLLNNETVSLEDIHLKKIKALASESADVAEQFLAYDALPREMAVDIYWHVSLALRRKISKEYGINSTEVNQALEDCIQDFSDTMLQPNAVRPSSLMNEVANMYHKDDRITDQLLVGSLRRRQGRFFLALFAKRTNLSIDIIWNMMRQIGGQGLAVACRAMNISKENFVSIFLLSRTIVKSNQPVDANELRMAMRYYDGLTYKMANEILKDSIAS